MSEDPYYPRTDPMQKNSVLAIVSLVCGIAAYTFIPFLAAIAAVITGYMALAEINKNNGTLTGKGMAITGLIMGYFQIACIFVVIFVLLLLAPQLSTIFSNITSNLH